MTTRSYNLAGATFRQDELRKAYKQTNRLPFDVVLNREPDNVHDKNAIAVHSASDNTLLGYIPRAEQHHWRDLGRPLTGACQMHYWAQTTLYLARFLQK